MPEKNKEINEIIAEEIIMKDKIIEIMKKGPVTVPEIAEIINKPTDQVMVWVMGMRKYGIVSETEEITDDNYYKYELVTREGIN